MGAGDSVVKFMDILTSSCNTLQCKNESIWFWKQLFATLPEMFPNFYHLLQWTLRNETWQVLSNI